MRHPRLITTSHVDANCTIKRHIDIKMTFKLKTTIGSHVCRYNASKWNGWIMCKLRELNKQKEEGKNCSMDLIEGNAQWHEDIYLLTDTSFDVTRFFILLKYAVRASFLLIYIKFARIKVATSSEWLHHNWLQSLRILFKFFHFPWGSWRSLKHKEIIKKSVRSSKGWE